MTMTTSKRKLSPSLEDYLEGVLELVERGKVARVRDIAKRLGVGMPSVSVALRALGQRGLVNYDPYQVVTLTDKGRRAALEIQQRHDVLQKFLINVLGIDETTAAANACRMEHAVDPVVLDRLKRLAEFLQACPAAIDGNVQWQRSDGELSITGCQAHHTGGGR